MKKIITLLLALTMILGMVACSPNAPSTEGQGGEGSKEPAAPSESSDTGDKESSGSKEKLVIAWSDGNSANEHNAICTRIAKEHAESITDYEIEFILLDGKGSGEAQVAHCETFIAQGVDCVIVQPYDAAACQVGVEMVAEAGIPVMVAKATIEDNSICPYVGQDDTIAGEIEMKWIAEQLGGKGNIVILEGPTGNSAAIKRNDGIKNVLKDYPDIKVLYSQPGDWHREEGMALMENWLQMGEKIDAVVAHNDEMALGAYDAISDAGLAGEILVIGIDAIEAALKSVAAGELDATVLQDVENIARTAVDTAIRLATGEEVEKTIFIDPILVTKDNVNDYLN